MRFTLGQLQIIDRALSALRSYSIECISLAKLRDSTTEIELWENIFNEAATLQKGVSVAIARKSAPSPRRRTKAPSDDGAGGTGGGAVIHMRKHRKSAK